LGLELLIFLKKRSYCIANEEFIHFIVMLTEENLGKRGGTVSQMKNSFTLPLSQQGENLEEMFT
jgi:hypothetical protein